MNQIPRLVCHLGQERVQSPGALGEVVARRERREVLGRGAQRGVAVQRITLGKEFIELVRIDQRRERALLGLSRR